MEIENRSGYFKRSSTGYYSFVPAPLPPKPGIDIDEEMQSLLSLADRKLGRLDGITQILPNPELFVAMYVKKEALLSSQIEGTQASFIEVLDRDVENEVDRNIKIADVVNYISAITYGLERLKTLPLSLRLIREIHEVLLKNARGSERNPGEFRISQNWIGPAGCSLSTATFIPPNVLDMEEALSNLETFMHANDYIPTLIKIAIIHAQFETIHPFLDGNGRMGRLLITFWLCQQNIMTQPLLYLSYYFKLNRSEYYDRLMDVRTKGDWENWIKFFLRGISIVSDEAIQSAKAILNLKEEYSKVLHQYGKKYSSCQYLLNMLFEYPIVQRKDVEDFLAVTNATAGDLIDAFCNLGILSDLTPDKKRNKKYVLRSYLDILEKGTEQYSIG